VPVADRGRGVRSWAETLRSPGATNETGGSHCGRWGNAKVAPGPTVPEATSERVRLSRNGPSRGTDSDYEVRSSNRFERARRDETGNHYLRLVHRNALTPQEDAEPPADQSLSPTDTPRLANTCVTAITASFKFLCMVGDVMPSTPAAALRLSA
jgi:hypothetical protein